MITHCEKFSVALYYSYNQYQVKYLNKMFKFFFLLLPFAAGSFMDTETPIPLLLGSSGDDRPTTTNRDDIDIISRTSRFYFLGPQKVNWFEAHYLCQQYGMELATVESAKEEAEIEELLKPEEPDNGFWISATRLGSCNLFVFFFKNWKASDLSQICVGSAR